MSFRGISSKTTQTSASEAQDAAIQADSKAEGAKESAFIAHTRLDELTDTHEAVHENIYALVQELEAACENNCHQIEGLILTAAARNQKLEERLDAGISEVFRLNQQRAQDYMTIINTLAATVGNLDKRITTSSNSISNKLDQINVEAKFQSDRIDLRSKETSDLDSRIKELEVSSWHWWQVIALAIVPQCIVIGALYWLLQ